jgi:Shedu protein SduA, C-terminal
VAATEGKLTEIVRPEVVRNFNAAIQQARYKNALAELDAMLSRPELAEVEYRKWFLKHDWIFGTEYLGLGPSIRVGWAAKGDIVLRTVDGYEDLIELKLPGIEILNKDSSHDNWYPSADLTKAIAQVIKYFQDSEDVRLALIEKEGLTFLKPRARIVAGRSYGWESAKRDALRRLNSALQNIQILTYDNILEAGHRLVKCFEAPNG